MNMCVLNTENRTLFNHLIRNSQVALAEMLPKIVTISLLDEYRKKGEMIPVETEVDMETRFQYVENYVDELDTFGDDLYEHPLDVIFKGCIKPSEIELLKQNASMNRQIEAIYINIWRRAFGKIMDTVKEDILYDAEKHFEEDKELYRQAYASYYEKRDEKGYTQADKDYLER